MIRNHFTATGIVFNSDRNILMIHHIGLGVWLPPGGHIDENELPDDAVLREIYEETGVKAAVLPLKAPSFSDSHCKELATPFVILLEDIDGDGTHNHIDMVYLCKAINEELAPQASEVNGIGWFSPPEIAGLETFENVTKTIADAVKYINENPDKLLYL